MKGICAVLVATSLALGSSAAAQRAISARDVLDATRAHHPRIVAEAARIRAASGELLASRGAFDPTLRASADAQRGGYYPNTRFDVAIEQQTPFAGAALSVGYRVTEGQVPTYYGERDTLDRGELRGGLRLPLVRDLRIDDARAQRARAELDVQAAHASFDASVLALERDALVAFYRYAAARRMLEVVEVAYRLAVDRDAQLARLVSTGAVAPVERLENERAVLARRARVRAAEQRLGQSALLLSLYLRDAEGRPMTITRGTPLEAPEPELGVALDVPGLVASARSQRPELRRFEALLERADVARTLARNGRRPRVDLRVTLSRDLGDGPEELAGTTIEAGLSVMSAVPNRAGRGRDDARLADLEALEAERQLFEEMLALDVERAVLDVVAANELVALERDAARAAEALAAAERRRLDEGATTMLVVNLREQAAVDAQLAVIERELEALAARATLDAVVGDVSLAVRPGR